MIPYNTPPIFWTRGIAAAWPSRKLNVPATLHGELPLSSLPELQLRRFMTSTGLWQPCPSLRCVRLDRANLNIIFTCTWVDELQGRIAAWVSHTCAWSWHCMCTSTHVLVKRYPSFMARKKTPICPYNGQSISVCAVLTRPRQECVLKTIQMCAGILCMYTMHLRSILFSFSKLADIRPRTRVINLTLRITAHENNNNKHTNIPVILSMLSVIASSYRHMHR